MSAKRHLPVDDPAVKPKRKPRIVLQRKWTSEEVLSILDYMKETILSNSKVEVSVCKSLIYL